jgi:hypothetical protein
VSFHDAMTSLIDFPLNIYQYRLSRLAWTSQSVSESRSGEWLIR